MYTGKMRLNIRSEEYCMSAKVIIRFSVSDVDKAKEALAENAALLEEISKDAQAGGALHHDFFEGDGELVVIDEWKSREAFESFFKSNDKIPTVTSAAGVEGAPEVEFLGIFDAPANF